MKLAPKRIRICPGCPNNDLELNTIPQFKFVRKTNNDTKTVTILGNMKAKISGKIKGLF